MGQATFRVPLWLALAGPLILTLGGGAALIAVLTLQSGQRAAETVVDQLSSELAREVGDNLTALMVQPMVLNQVNRNALASGLLDIDKAASRDRFFSGQMTAFPQVSYSFYGRPDASFYGARRNEANGIEAIHNDKSTGGSSVYFSIDAAGNPLEAVTVIKNFDCRTRPWYQAGAASPDPLYSAIYRHFVYKDLAITAVQGIFDGQGGLLGVLGVDFRLDRINGYLGSMSPISGSTITIVERATGLLVGNSLGLPNHGGEGTSFTRYGIADLKHPFLPGLYSQLLAQKTLATLEDSGYRFATPSGVMQLEVLTFRQANLDWLVLVSLPQAAFTKELDDNFRLTILLSLLTLFLSILLGFAVLRGTLHSLDLVVSATERIAKGDWNYRVPTGAYRELDLLARSFDTMARQLKESITGLETTVEERTQELAQKNRLLAEVNVTKDKFFAIVAHDLLGPVDAIARLLEALNEPDTSMEPEEIMEIHRELALSSRQVFHLLESLLHWAQAQRGEIVYQPEPNNLDALMSEALALMEARASAKQIRMAYEPKGYWALCDSNMVHTIVRNLLSNAIKFSHPGGLVELSTTLNGDFVEVSVRDRGLGMDAARVAKLFHLGEHIKGQGTLGEKGTGLGLLICQEFALRHGGGLEVQSVLGQGSEFRFRLAGVREAGPLAKTPG